MSQWWMYKIAFGYERELVESKLFGGVELNSRGLKGQAFIHWAAYRIGMMYRRLGLWRPSKVKVPWLRRSR